jgi:hypothetical protein
METDVAPETFQESPVGRPAVIVVGNAVKESITGVEVAVVLSLCCAI